MVFAGLAGVLGLLGPGNPPVRVLAACVCSFNEHVLIFAGHGVLLVHLSRHFHHGRLCADGVRSRRHHYVIGGVALSIDACLNIVGDGQFL